MTVARASSGTLAPIAIVLVACAAVFAIASLALRPTSDITRYGVTGERWPEMRRELDAAGHTLGYSPRFVRSLPSGWQLESITTDAAGAGGEPAVLNLAYVHEDGQRFVLRQNAGPPWQTVDLQEPHTFLSVGREAAIIRTLKSGDTQLIWGDGVVHFVATTRLSGDWDLPGLLNMASTIY